MHDTSVWKFLLTRVTRETGAATEDNHRHMHAHTDVCQVTVQTVNQTNWSVSHTHTYT